MKKTFKKHIKNFIRDSFGSIYYHSYKRFSNEQGNRSLIYHAFGLKLKHDTYGISIDINKFNEHIKYLYENYKIISLKDYANYDSNSISITIDDGYKDTISAIDILNSYDMPFDLFITTDNIDKKNHLSSQDIRDIASLNIANIGSHGCSHNRLTDLNSSQQSNEINESKEKLENIIGSKIESYSYPHGSHDNTTLKIMELSGYNYAASSIKGLNCKLTSKYTLRRSEIISTDTIKDVSKKIRGYYDYY